MQCNSETCELPKNSPVSPVSDYLPPLSVLKGLKLQKLNSDGGKEEVDSESLWRDNSCLLYLVRRPGCVLCRVNTDERFYLFFAE